MSEAVAKNNPLDKVMAIKVGFFPLPIYLIMAAVLAGSHLLGVFEVNLYTGAMVAAVYACGAVWVVDKIPLLNKLTQTIVILVIPVLTYFALVPQEFIDAAGEFYMGGMGFQTCYVMSIICGSILSMDRGMLIKAGARYLLPVMGGLICSYGLSALLSGVLGAMSWSDTLLYIAGAIMGGGNSAGAMPMSQIYANLSGLDQGELYSRLFAWMSLGQWMALGVTIVLTWIGARFPSTTGNGVLMKENQGEENAKAPSYDFKYEFSDVMVGVGVVVSILLFGSICSHFFPTFHAYVFAILLVAAAKILGFVPKRIEYSCYVLYNGFIKKITLISLGAVSLCMFDLHSLFEILTIKNVLVSLSVVVGAAIGAWFFGRLAGFHPVESALTAGMCMANAGGNGDIIILTAANRMELMPFAQISSRIGGAIVLVIQSLLAARFLG
jgi:Na+/citrate or Na+/malate symporter